MIKGRDSKAKDEDNRLVLMRAFYQGAIWFCNEVFQELNAVQSWWVRKQARARGMQRHHRRQWKDRG